MCVFGRVHVSLQPTLPPPASHLTHAPPHLTPPIWHTCRTARGRRRKRTQPAGARARARRAGRRRRCLPYRLLTAPGPSLDHSGLVWPGLAWPGPARPAQGCAKIPSPWPLPHPLLPLDFSSPPSPPGLSPPPTSHQGWGEDDDLDLSDDDESPRTKVRACCTAPLGGL